MHVHIYVRDLEKHLLICRKIKKFRFNKYLKSGRKTKKKEIDDNKNTVLN